MATVELTLDSFEPTMQKSQILFVDFWAAWCGPCRMFGPIFEKASEKYPDIVFGKVDTEAEQEIANMAGISSIPTLMAFRDGILLFNQSGALPEANFEELIQAILAVDMESVKKEMTAQEQPST
jgi:thioredoxin 1